MLSQGDVEKIVVINKELVEVYIKQSSFSKPQYAHLPAKRSGSIGYGPQYTFTIGSLENFEQHLDEAAKQLGEEVPVSYQSRQAWLSRLGWLMPIAAIFFFWYLLSGRAGGGRYRSALDFGKSKPIILGKDKAIQVTFKDVAGYTEAKREIMEIVDFLRKPSGFTRLGARIPKGILLIGAPGTGKTLMAKAVAGEAGVPFLSLSGSEFVEMFVGVGASRVRDLFEQAKQRAPCIIFVDEIDTIGKMRGKAMSLQANDERESTLNQLLSEMDGFDPNKGIIVLAATNRADILDPALLRAGRFDRHIHLDLPDKAERKEIFGVHLARLTLDPHVDSGLLAVQTTGFSGADIANVCNEAALIAARRKADSVGVQDFTDAIDRQVGGLEKKGKLISPAERKVIAFHEAGHAVTSWLLKHTDPLQKVTIIPRGKSLGSSWYLPEERKIITKQQFMDRLCATLGGRMAEEVVFREVSSGALDDLEKATKLAYTMVSSLGMGQGSIGNMSYYDSTGAYESSLHKPYSEETARKLDEEAKSLVDQATDTCRRILEANMDKLNRLAELLLQKEVVYKEELETILGIRELVADPGF